MVGFCEGLFSARKPLKKTIVGFSLLEKMKQSYQPHQNNLVHEDGYLKIIL